ncbi:MAG: hypothetical protein RLZ10_2446 [Bacteroidota bacterium]|jgi:hypothetical protein
MEFIEIKNEFNWVVKILNSSRTKEHISASEKLFENFIKKWDSDLSDVMKLKYQNEFNQIKNGKVSNIQLEKI